MNRLKCIGAVALAALLAGCGSPADVAHIFPASFRLTEPMTAVIAPGYETAFNGKLVYVFGKSSCQEGIPFKTFIFGASKLLASNDCIVITPTSTQVQAIIVVDGKLMHETWTVERKAPWVILHRPSGDLVL